MLEVRQRTAVEEWQADRAYFFEERKTMLGGSDVAAIMGLARWKTAMDVWVEKTGLVESSVEMNLRQFIGLRLEGLIAEMAGARLGRTYRRMPARLTPDGHRTTLVRHKQFPHLAGHLDFVGLEAKTSYSAEGWGEDGTEITSDKMTWDAVPIDYLLQVEHYLFVTGWPVITLAVLIGHDDFRTYDVRPVSALIEPMEKEADRFWRENVIDGAVPDLDHSEGTKAYLRAKFPRATGSLRAATPEDTLVIEQYRQAVKAAQAATNEQERIKALLKNRVGHDLGIAGPGVTVTWQEIKQKGKVHYDLIADGLRKAIEQARAPRRGKRRRGIRVLDRLDLDTLTSLHTEEPGSYRKIDVRYSRRDT